MEVFLVRRCGHRSHGTPVRILDIEAGYFDPALGTIMQPMWRS
jgi:hypothetical protein